MCGHKATRVHASKTFLVHTLIDFSDTGVKKIKRPFEPQCGIHKSRCFDQKVPWRY